MVGKTWVESKVDGPKIQKGPSWGLKLDDLKKWKWTVLESKSGRSLAMKVDGLEIQKKTVLRYESGRSYGVKVDSLKKWKSVLKFKNRRYQGIKVNSLVGWKWTVFRWKIRMMNKGLGLGKRIGVQGLESGIKNFLYCNSDSYHF